MKIKDFMILSVQSQHAVLRKKLHFTRFRRYANGTHESDKTKIMYLSICHKIGPKYPYKITFITQLKKVMLLGTKHDNLSSTSSKMPLY